MATVVALRNIISSFRDIGSRSKGEKFTCADWLAVELQKVGDVRVESGPKDERASPAGRKTASSSSRPAPASRTPKSRK